MEGIIGVILGAGGGWAAWWAFHQATAGGHDWLRPVSIIIGAIGVILIFDFIRRWWIAD